MDSRVSSRIRDASLIVGLTALTVAFNWPITDLRHPVLPAHDDSLFSVWRLAWVAYQLRANPAQLFDANIFWPENGTLAYSDAMLMLGAVGAPLIWLGVHPVVVHNLLLIASFVSAGYVTARLLRYLGADSSGQVVGAVIFAFAPYRVAHLGHLELLWTALVPGVLLGVYKTLTTPRVLTGVAVGAALAIQALCSIYYFVFLLIWLVPAILLAPWHVPVVWCRRHVVAALAAAVTAAIVVWPYARVFDGARQDLGPRSTVEVRRYSALPADYLNVPAANALYDAAPSESADERSLFVGTIPMLLVLLSLYGHRNRAVLPMLTLGLIAFDLSLGVNGLSYNIAAALLPPLDSFRAPARFAVFVLLAVAALAGLATTDMMSRLRSPRWRLGAVTFVLAGLMAEYVSSPVATSAMPLQPPEVYRWLAQQPHAVTLELPVPTPDALWKYETTFEYFSIYHWQPLANGYSGHAPRSYVRLLDVVRDFPSERSLRFLQNRKISVILLHERLMPHGAFDRLLVACGNREWFAEAIVFDDPQHRRIAACRLLQP